jgi:hypothetical protein
MKTNVHLLAVSLLAVQACATAPRPEGGGDSVPLYALDPAPVPEASEVSRALPDEPAPEPPLLGPDWVQDAPEPAGAAPMEAARAESPWERFTLGGGIVLVGLDSAVRFGPAGLGVQVNLEELLGFDTSTSSARIEGAWRFTENKRHRAKLSWIDLSRKGSTTLKQDLDLGNGTVLPAGSGVSSDFNLNLIKAEYSYSFFQDDRFDLAGAAGFYVAPMDFSLSASGLSTYKNSFNVTAPLPLVGLRMDFAITPKWFLRSDMSLFYLQYQDYTGRMRDITMAVEYKAWKNFAFGLGFDSFGLFVERNRDTTVPGVNFTGSVDFQYTGLMLYLKGLW